MMSLEEIHAVLKRANDGIAALHGRDLRNVSADTAMAIGEALGTIRKSMVLVGRDIDDRNRLEVSHAKNP